MDKIKSLQKQEIYWSLTITMQDSEKQLKDWILCNRCMYKIKKIFFNSFVEYI